jgi:two-component system, NarL family, invasion response regulator UvrY
MTRVLLIDDHPIVLQGCRRVLQDAGVCDVIEATSAVAGYRLYRRNHPETIIMDLSLQGNRLGRAGLSGLDLLRRIRSDDSRIPILVLSMHGDPVIVSSALEAGATGYLLKDAAPGNLLKAFETVCRHRLYLCHELAIQVALLGVRRQGETFVGLSSRELQTLALVAEGKTYEEIAEQLRVSYKTVANTCSQLKTKLGARKLPELIRMGVEYLSLSPDRPGHGSEQRAQDGSSARHPDRAAVRSA